MEFAITLLVTFFAGMGAGLGTGFAGMSAAAVISPMLITFLGMDPYSGGRHRALVRCAGKRRVRLHPRAKTKNLDIRNGLIMMVSVLAFTVVGSYAASLVPSTTMGGFSVFMTFLLGVKFIVRPVMTTKEAMAGVKASRRAVYSLRRAHRLYLRLHRRGRRHDDAAHPHLRARLRAQDRRGHQRFHHDLHSAHRRGLALSPSAARRTGRCSRSACSSRSSGRALPPCSPTRLLPKRSTARPAWCSSSSAWSSCSSTFWHKEKAARRRLFQESSFPAARRRTSAARPRRPRPRRSAHRRTAARTPRPTSSSESRLQRTPHERAKEADGKGYLDLPKFHKKNRPFQVIA